MADLDPQPCTPRVSNFIGPLLRPCLCLSWLMYRCVSIRVSDRTWRLLSVETRPSAIVRSKFTSSQVLLVSITIPWSFPQVICDAFEGLRFLLQWSCGPLLQPGTFPTPWAPPRAFLGRSSACPEASRLQHQIPCLPMLIHAYPLMKQYYLNYIIRNHSPLSMMDHCC